MEHIRPGADHREAADRRVPDHQVVGVDRQEVVADRCCRVVEVVDSYP